MSDNDTKPNDQFAEWRTIAPERVVERARGCWNCSGWSNDPDVVRTLYRQGRAATLLHLQMTNQGSIPQRTGMIPFSANFYKHIGELVRQGLTQDEAISRALAEEGVKLPTGSAHTAHRLAFFDALVKNGSMGVCFKGHAPEGTQGIPLLHAQYFCDKWCAAQGASIATEGAKMDKLPAELREAIDGKKVS